jgi:hypothetical protein
MFQKEALHRQWGKKTWFKRHFTNSDYTYAYLFFKQIGCGSGFSVTPICSG